MTDNITSVTQNHDGTWTFWYSFDTGDGVVCNAVVIVPLKATTTEAPATPAVMGDDGSVLTPEVPAASVTTYSPYELNEAREASIILAKEKKASWLVSIAGLSAVGPVVLE